MRRLHAIRLALVAVFVMGAVGAANASAALPEFQQAGVSLAKVVTFTSVSGEKILFGGFGTEIVCKKDKNSGQTSGPKHILVTITFEECERGKNTGNECQNQGAGTKRIVTNEIKGWLYYIKSTAPVEVGTFFASNSAGEPTVFAKFKCVGLIGELTVESTNKTELEGANPPAHSKCLAAGTWQLNGANPPARTLNISSTKGELVVKTEVVGGVRKQAIKNVTYNTHNFECELTTNGFASQEEEVEPPGDVITFAEAVELKA